MKKSVSLNVKYIFINIFYFMMFCSMIGYSTVFLLDKGYNNSTIGVILALSSVISVLLQPILAAYLDKKANISIKNIISLIILIIFIFSISIFFITDTILLPVIVIIYTMSMVIQPFLNSLTFAFERKGIIINFGLARGMGSVSYAVTSLILGNLIARYNSEVLPVFYVILAMIILILVYSFDIPSDNKEISLDYEESRKQLSVLEFLKKYRKFTILLIGIVFVLMNTTIINNFMIQVVSKVGGDGASMGNALFLAAILELPTMAYFKKIKEKINCGKLLLVSSVLFCVKYVLTFMATSMTMIYVAQTLQIATYALLIPASVYYVKKLVEDSDMIKGQALITGAMGLAGVFGSLFGGIMIDYWGIAETLLIGTVIGVFGVLFVWIGHEKV